MTIEQKAAAWDKLYNAILKYYEYDDEGNEIEPPDEDGLLSIGEIAATHLGFL